MMILDDIALNKMDDNISDVAGGLFTTSHNDEFLNEDLKQIPMNSHFPLHESPTECSLLSLLQDKSVFYALAGELPLVYKSSIIQRDKYNDKIWHEIMIDTGAGKYSTAGYEQFLAFTKLTKNTSLNTTFKVSVAFGKGPVCNSIGFINVSIPLGKVDFHILDANTPFSLCIAGMKRLNVYLNNVDDKVYMKMNTTAQDSQYDKKHIPVCPVVMKFGHPFLD